MYHKVPSQQVKLNYGDGTALHVRFRGFEDTVVWNPTESIGKDIHDMEDGGWVSGKDDCKVCADECRKGTFASSLDMFESSKRSSRERSFWDNKY